MKIGIIGAGQIVPEFLQATKKIEDIELEGICAVGMMDHLLNLQKEYGIKAVFEDADKMMNTIESDTIYVAVPNHIHYIMAKKALELGKNVILEKPFTITKQEAEELFALAEKKKLFLFEAITTMHSPNYLKCKEMVKELPCIKLVYLNYTQYSSRYDAFKKGEILPAFDYKKAGGALRDINIYNIHFVIGLFGKPNEVVYYPNIVHNVDVSGTLVLKYDDFACTLIGSKDCGNNAEIRIQGDKQTLLSHSPANVFFRFSKINDKEEETIDLLTIKERLYYELHDFDEIIKNKDYDEMNRLKEHTLNVMEVVERAFANQH